MENWDEAKLKEVVEKKHGEQKKMPTTDIICKYFLDAVEKSKYGWFWSCPNGESCIYKHALPPGFVLKKVEPVWYIPVIPMILVNGASGIGTGWMTKIPNYNPRQIVQVLKNMMKGEEPPHLCCFDRDSVLKRYESIKTILQEFYTVTLEYYDKRKAWLEGMLEAEARKLSNQARFIVEQWDGILTIENKEEKAMIEELVEKGYDSDPVKAWKVKLDREALLEEKDGAESQEEDESNETQDKGPDYDYLLGMSMWSLTKEEKDELLRKRDEKQTELRVLQAKSAKDLWTEDLDASLEKLDEVEAKEELDEAGKTVGEKAAKLKPGMSKKQAHMASETMPSPQGRRVQPKIAEETKKKLENKERAKENKGKQTKKIEEEADKDEFDLLAEDQKSLTEKLGNSPDIIEKKLKAAKKEETEYGGFRK